MNGASVLERDRKRKERRGFRRVFGRAALFIVFATVAGVAVLFASWRGRHVEVSEGLTLQWLGVTEGTNWLVEGNPLEKMLGDWIPAKGIGIGGLKLQRPKSYPLPDDWSAPITAWVRARGSGLKLWQEMEIQNNYGFRVLTSNSTGRELENPPAIPYRMGLSNELIFVIPLSAFPRDEKNVRVRLGPPRDDRAEMGWAEFKFRNPLRGALEQWEVGNVPSTNDVGNDRFVLFDVLSRPTSLTFHRPGKGWSLFECRIWDEEGNSSRMSSAGYEEREITATFDYPLELDRAWRVTAIFRRAPPHRLQELGEFVPEDRLRVEVGAGMSDVSATNSQGVVYKWRFDGELLSTWNANDPSDGPPFFMLSAKNELGAEVKFLETNWNEKGGTITQVWPTRERASTLTLEMGFSRIVSVEFFVRPDRGRSE